MSGKLKGDIVIKGLSFFIPAIFMVIVYTLLSFFAYENNLLLSLLKIGLFGLLFNIYLSKKFGASYTTLIFSTVYALSVYAMSYQSNEIWLDGIVCFPLVLLGIEKLIDANKVLCYVISLSVMIVCNYCIGYIVGGFSILYFSYVLLISTPKFGKKELIKKISTFLLATLISFGTIVALLILRRVPFEGKAALSFWLDFGDVFYPVFTGIFEWQDIIRSLPVVVCGFSSVSLVILFFFNKNISKREKVISGGFLLLVSISLQISYLNIAWRGFEFAVEFWQSTSFMIIAFMLMVSYKSLLNLREGVTPVQVVGAAITCCLMLFFTLIIWHEYYQFVTLFLPFCVILVTLIWFMFFVVKKDDKSQRILVVGLAFVCSIDVVASTYFCLKKNSMDMNQYEQHSFEMGSNYNIYNKLGAHLTQKDGVEGVYFALWAPNAIKVSVVGDFNEWNVEAHPMECQKPLGIYELFIPGIQQHSRYKYCVTQRGGEQILKSDPFSIHNEMRPGTASIVERLDGYEWNDQEWMDKRKRCNADESPMFIYEVHLGSWKKDTISAENPYGFYNYKELAHSLAEYVLEMGYTHVELMGIAEYPLDASWGYQVTGYFAPTSRHGTPHEFMYLVDYLHSKGIGVILDWVPAHFPKDESGLALFDGTNQYEYEDPRKGEHLEWGTKVFDYNKDEVRNFLISNAVYWLNEYHIDGFRVDAVASMLYLDYSRNEWLPNEYGGNENWEVVEFLKLLNSVIESRGDGALMIAEESTTWPQVTGTPKEDGLGFDFKWNMGWMNDFLEYMEMEPKERLKNSNMVSFSTSYTYSEKYILSLSHDEVVHGKGSLLEKMSGSEEEQFSNLKVVYGFMLGHPGKKLLFMGQDFAQRREWSEARELDWYLLSDSKHQNIHEYMRELLKLYHNHPCLYELDMEEEGFEWMNADNQKNGIFSFVRHSKDGKDNLLFICNFTPTEREDYRVGALKNKQHTLLLESTWESYGDEQEAKNMKVQPEKVETDGMAYSITYPLKPYSVVVFQF